MASTRVTKVYTNTGDRRTYTVSAWVKRSKLGATQDVISAYRSTDGLQTDVMRFPSDDTFQFYMHSTNSAGNCELKTNRKFRDTNAWYHIVTRVDTTQSTNTNRVRIYINGVQETSFATENYMNQNGEGVWGIGASHTTHTIGAVGTANYFDGYVSHVHYADGQSLAPTVFGSTDSVTGEWSINTDPSFTLGTNGFTILKDGNTVTDQSTNSNDFSVAAGTLTKTEDNPSNVFATMNALSAGSDMTFGNGNTKIRNDVGTWNSGVSTIAPATGKYYWEVYVHGGGDNNTGVTLSSAYGGTHSEVDAGRVVYSRNGYIYREGLSGQSNYATGVTYGDGDYIGVAFDTENGTLSFYKNGSAVSNSTTTDTSFLRTNNEYIVQCGLYNGGEFRFNFGNGAFGSTQLTGTTYQGDGNIGIFKYQPPTGYTALSTKGLNE